MLCWYVLTIDWNTRWIALKILKIEKEERQKAKGGRRYKCKEKEGENYKFYKQMCVSQLENIEK